MSIPTIYNWPNDTRGDTVAAKQFVFTDENGAPVDLTDVAIRMQLKNGRECTCLDVTDGAGITKDNINTITVESFTVQDIGVLTYDMEFTFPDGTVRTWLKGTITIEQDITNAN